MSKFTQYKNNFLLLIKNLPNLKFISQKKIKNLILKKKNNSKRVYKKNIHYIKKDINFFNKHRTRWWRLFILMYKKMLKLQIYNQIKKIFLYFYCKFWTLLNKKNIPLAQLYLISIMIYNSKLKIVLSKQDIF